ncbi:HDIG domain-containing metalloprotein, partial [Bacillus cereus]
MIVDKHFYDTIPVNREITDEKAEAILQKYEVPQFSQIETVSIADMQPKEKVKNVPVLIGSFTDGVTGTGSQHATIKMMNSAGSFTAKLWDNNTGIVNKVKGWIEGKEYSGVYLVSGEIKVWAGNKQLTLDSIEPTLDRNPMSFLPKTQSNLEKIVLELFSYIHELPKVNRSAVKKYFDSHWNEFVTKPAAKGWHHTYVGGLIKHKVGVLRVAHHIASSPDPYRSMIELIDVANKAHQQDMINNLNSEVPKTYRYLPYGDGGISHLYELSAGFAEACKTMEVDWATLATAAIFHDVGKELEYAMPGENINKFDSLYLPDEPYFANAIEMDPSGSKLGHIYLGLKMFQKTSWSLDERFTREQEIEI